MAEVRREHKDRLFCDLFSEKENALSLYNAVSGTAYTDVDALQIVTLKDVLYLTMKNDVALCFHDDLDLFEHQSSVNPNMPLRGFLYFGREYEGWLAQNQIDIYSSSLVKIPAPKYYVLYNGKATIPEYQELRLSDAFAEPSPGYEWTAHMLNINIGYNEELMQKCPPLLGFATLIQLIRDYQSAGMNLEEAIRKATDDCIERDLLKDYLLKNKGEVLDMVMTEYNEELRERTLKEEGIEKLGSLITRLINLGRNDDIQKVAIDPIYRNKLFQEFQLT